MLRVRIIRDFDIFFDYKMFLNLYRLNIFFLSEMLGTKGASHLLVFQILKFYIDFL